MVTVSFMSFINMLNRKGLRRLPCGKPHRTGDQLEHLLLHITLCLRPCNIKNSHEFDLDDVKIIDRCSQWSKRLFLQAWHSIREPNAINEHIYIPDIYKALGNPK